MGTQSGGATSMLLAQKNLGIFICVYSLGAHEKGWALWGELFLFRECKFQFPQETVEWIPVAS